MFKKIFTFFFAALLSARTFSQVTPHINSGNPAIPFPQFLDYGADRKTLASVNAPGVTHAEMEQRTREAWQLVCNNTSPYPNTIVSGVQYLYPTAPNHCTCVEGDGYYLLGAAIMGDKTYFDGYYMWAHDRAFQGIKRFIDGQYNTPNYGYNKGLSGAGSLGAGTGVLGGGINGNSATDGDEDVALALLIAYKQWGEHSNIILNNDGWNGKEINYKEEALQYIRAMVDTNIFPLALPVLKYVCGDIGLDGYLKNGDSWAELTDWAVPSYNSIPNQNGGNNMVYFDYNCPAWLRQFRTLLESENDNPFYLKQLKRGEASGDWLMGNLYSQNVKNIPVCGQVLKTSSPSNFEFHNDKFAEDFRAGWRTILNYVWHDNPSFTWDPVTHEVIDSKPNTFERDMGLRFAKFLKNPQDATWGNACSNIGDLKDKLTFKGPYTLRDKITLDGVITAQNFPLNWIHGAGAPSAIVAQDFELMGDMFRQCVIAWDAGTGQNLDSRPLYFHEWYRLCGMLILSGNFHAPSNMVARPNLKVYHKVDKTYAFTGDQLTFTVSYRNYGSVDASGAVVKFGIPKGFEFVSSTKGSLSGDSVVWSVGVAKGFKTGALTATMDSMKVTLKIGPTASGRYCTNARISSTSANATGWVSNEYPNNITAVMERNCVDVVKRALKISKTADRNDYNPGQDVKFKIKFENSSDAGWINGGRPGVRLAYAHAPVTDPSAEATNYLQYRLFHDAAEAYIDYGNYRVSYFMNDPTIKCYSGDPGCTTGWDLTGEIAEGVDFAKVKVSHQLLVPGQDDKGKWNQRLVLQFSPQLATITQHLQQYTGSPGMVHEGGMAVLRGVWRLVPNNNSKSDFTDDWSWDASFSDVKDGLFYPIGDDYTDPNNLGLSINSWHKSACQTSNKIMKKVLVEEWDGYTWRRAFGTGPTPGRDLADVEIRDTLPIGVTFKSFIKAQALDSIAKVITIAGGRSVIVWKVPAMQVNQKDSIQYIATVSGSCPNTQDATIVNKAWIKAATESAISGNATINVTCAPVAICPTSTTMSKKSEKSKYLSGERVKYTIGYKQTLGSVTSPNLSSATNWTIRSGNASSVQFGATGITLPQINGGDPAVLVTNDQISGTNTVGDGIEGIINLAAGEGEFAFVLRYSAGKGVYVLVNPGGSPGNLTSVSVYDGSNLASPLKTFDGLPMAASFNFRIKLSGPSLAMWLVPSTQDMSGGPNIEFTGVPVVSGSFGLSHGVVQGKGNAYGFHRLVDMKAHMETAYDAQIIDSIPANITVNPSSISSSGVLSSDSKAIIWTLASPMAFNDSVTLTWEGTYKECKKTTNIAYVNTRGITGNQYGVCYDINCGTCSAPVSVVVRDTSMTAGSTTTLTAKVSPPSTSYIYNWYKLIGTRPDTSFVRSGTTNTLSVSDSGRYVVRVFDGDTTKRTCSKLSNTAKVSYGCSTPGTVTLNDTTFETGGNIVLTAKMLTTKPSYIYTWFRSVASGSVFIASNKGINTLTVSDTGRYFVRVSDGDTTNSLCNKLSRTATISYGCTPPVAAITTNPLFYCSNTRGLTLTAQPVAGMDYKWFKRGLPVGTNSNVLANADSGVYTVQVGKGACTTTSSPVTVGLTPQPLAEIDTIKSKLKYCVGSKGELVAASAGTGAAYFWLFNGQGQGSAADSNNYIPSTVIGPSSSWQVVTTLNGCSDTSKAVKMAEVQAYATKIEVEADRTDACIGTLVNVFVTSKTDGTIKWYQDGVEQVGKTDVSYSFNFSQNTKVWAELTTTETCADPKVDSASVTIKQNTEAAALDLAVQQQLPACEGQPLTFVAKTTGGVPRPRYTWTVNNRSVAATNDTLFTSTTLKNGDLIEVLTKDACDTSKVVMDTMTVRGLTPVVTPSVSLKPMGSKVCVGQTVTFKVETQSGQGSSPDYAWFVNGEQKKMSKEDSFQLDVTAQVEVYVKLITTQMCASSSEASSDVITLDTTNSATPSLKITYKKVTPCPDDKAVAFIISDRTGEGNNPVYKWFLNNKLVSVGDTFTTSTLAQGDIVMARLISDLPCRKKDSADSDPIIYMPADPLTVSLFGNVNGVYSKGICKGDPIPFDVQYNTSDPVSFQWYVNSVLQDDQNASTISLSTLNNGDMLRVKAYLPACPNMDIQDSMKVNVDVKPLEGFKQGTISLCKGDTTIVANESNPNYTYKWERGRVVVGNTPTLTVSEPDQYVLSITNGQCTVPSTIRVVKPSLNVKALADPINFVPGDLVKLDVAVDNQYALTLAYSWSPKSLIQPSDVQQTSFYPQETMWVKVRVTANGGCSAEDSVQIFKTDRLFIPNAITPETGDQNAFWNIRGTEAYPELEVRVFNRWGSLVHEQKGYSTPWDGTLNGKPLPTGTYYYVLKDKKFDQPKVGDLTLVR